ncbi:hypothetical protein [Streptomyces sp. NPDC007083]|uniref:hypothetical protein n=1 Tax=Streptomyces sp. NPDC007083 TaxID=3156913 RepID=UPI0033E33AA2
MSEGQQVEQQQEMYGSRFAQMFGYVTAEDREHWEQQRAQNKPNVNAIKQGTKSSVGSMLEFGDRNINAKLNAAHRIADQEQFDKSHAKIVNKQRDPKTQSIIETVDYAYTGDRQEIEPDFEM